MPISDYPIVRAVGLTGNDIAGGATDAFRLLSSAATTNPAVIKNSAGRVYTIQGENMAGARRYLKLYDKATAPTVGTDTPKRTIPLPGGGTFSMNLSGLQFQAGIAMALTTGFADNDTGAVGAGEIMTLNVDYG